jgi:hypothetical protein
MITEQPRVVSWFSCGANSAVATKLAIKKYGLDRVEIVYCDTGGEHPDNIRYLTECEEWFGKPIQILRNPKYKDHMDLWEKERFISSPQGARCTVELKKRLRIKYQRVDDIQIMGYSYDEQHRADRFIANFPEVTTDFILIEQKLQKQDCMGLMSGIGIELPMMYKLGFNNNNCIGCCKGGKGYWNHIRKHFPEHFDRAAKIERINGHSITDVYLDELDPKEGNHKEPVLSCDFLCQSLDIDLK